MVKDGWSAANIRTSLLEEIKKIIQSDIGKRKGLTNSNQFIDWAVREKVEELEQAGISHLNLYEDHVKILDSRLGKLGRIVSVYFKRDGKPYCDYCEEPDCVHVQYAWEIPEARKVLEGYGLKPPPSKV